MASACERRGERRAERRAASGERLAASGGSELVQASGEHGGGGAARLLSGDGAAAVTAALRPRRQVAATASGANGERRAVEPRERRDGEHSARERRDDAQRVSPGVPRWKQAALSPRKYSSALAALAEVQDTV